MVYQDPSEHFSIPYNRRLWLSSFMISIPKQSSDVRIWETYWIRIRMEDPVPRVENCRYRLFIINNIGKSHRKQTKYLNIIHVNFVFILLRVLLWMCVRS